MCVLSHVCSRSCALIRVRSHVMHARMYAFVCLLTYVFCHMFALMCRTRAPKFWFKYVCSHVWCHMCAFMCVLSYVCSHMCPFACVPSHKCYFMHAFICVLFVFSHPCALTCVLWSVVQSLFSLWGLLCYRDDFLQS